MEPDTHVPMEELELFRRFVSIADWAWNTVQDWAPLARDTVGEQLVRACDAVGANLVEGDGRYSDADALHFFVIARASARETRYWVQRAMVRGLVEHADGVRIISELVAAAQLLNRLITYRRKRGKPDRVKDHAAIIYDADPFAQRFDENEQ
jgi:four helix bundle protein